MPTRTVPSARIGTVSPGGHQSPSASTVVKASHSRRSSLHSSVSSVLSAKSRSLLSGEGAEKSPVIDGNAQVHGNLDCGDKIISVVHSADGSSLIGGLMNGSIRIFNTSSGLLHGILENEDTASEAMPISRLKCKPGHTESTCSNIIAATYVSGHLRVWNYVNGQCISQVQDENKDVEYLCLSYNPFADVIAVGLDNGHIKLYDERTMQVTSLLKRSLSPSKVDGHTDRVFCIANHPLNPHEFVSSGWDNTLQFWDARAPHAVRSVYGVFVCGEGLAFDKRGRELMVAHWRPWRNLQFLEYSSGNVIGEVEPDLQHPHYLTCAQYVGKDCVIAAGTDRSIVKLIDRHTKSVFATVKEVGAVYDIDVAHKGQMGGNKFVVASRHHITTMDFVK